MKTFIHNNILYKLGWVNYLIGTKEPKDFLSETLEQNPIKALTDLMFQFEKLNHKLIRVKEGKENISEEQILSWNTELDEFIFNIEILISEFKVSNEDQKKAEEKAKSMLNMWILKKFTQYRWATKEEHFS
jgi:hypothetical protein